MTQLFIVYRHQDAGAMAQQVINTLMPIFGADDISSIYHTPPPGADRRSVTAERVQNADVVVVLIGRMWTRDPQLQAPDDLVRIGLETALRHQKAIIPVLIHGAVMPTPTQLPQSLQSLSYKGVLNMRDEPDFSRDMARFIETIRRASPPAQRQPVATTVQPARPPVQTVQSHYATAPQVATPKRKAREPERPSLATQAAGAAARGCPGTVWWIVKQPGRALFWVFSLILEQMLRSTISLVMTLFFIALFFGTLFFFGGNLIQNDLNITETLNAIAAQVQGLIETP